MQCTDMNPIRPPFARAFPPRSAVHRNFRQQIGLRHLCEEPFRLFFPAAVLAGLAGVALWPLYFGKLTGFYPNLSHARLMAHGFFGGFIFGFLGTALPRMIAAPKLTGPETALFFGLFLAMAGAHAAGNNPLGDALFLALLAAFLLAAGVRFFKRKDLPPPGFVLVPLAFACAMGGAVISLLERRSEWTPFWLLLKPLLYYQGFVLLPILGVGGFILPRFFGLPNKHDYDTSPTPPPGWTARMLWSLAVGAAILGSFVIEAGGWQRAGHLLRLAACAGWLLHEVPFHRAPAQGNALSLALKAALALLFLGILVLSVHPGHRVAWLHLTLVGGFGVITLTVATRVVFGHSGNAHRLDGRNRWFLTAVGLMLLAMATRISGDFWPKIMVSHYNYGAALWFAGVALWAAVVLPKVLRPDPEE